jgi:NAD(P)-dependent dehydrogenase (short-subunit alcohol dehydrogenase family)
MKQVWFVTGSSRGFGRALVVAALQAGDLVAATARRPEQLAEQLLAEDRKWRAVSRSADFAEPYPAEFPPDNAD